MEEIISYILEFELREPSKYCKLRNCHSTWHQLLPIMIKKTCQGRSWNKSIITTWKDESSQVKEPQG